MDVLYWAIIIVLMVLSFVGLIYPILPSVLFLLASFLLYGVFYDFTPFNWVFWTVQILFVVLLFGADYLANLVGVKRFGGTKAGIWGSTIGLLIGPFVIPVFGIIAGPFLGAIIGEWLVHRSSLKQTLKVGVGSVVGFISSVFTKGLIQLVMVIYFFVVV
ncbi:DUF456 domain-containing protein [Rossellomorea aquimaris]|uniref:DUF456 domain-containing protein n=1 Tax=Rossellomorea aquimaris TaxID=189382 RepID=UPI001CD51BBB|nr:DUF456 domain-containing protein [Rossellomorea aquimaris]MCA1054846.1 DUF456 domain-containing protein [Rossellomorea aquimaris]